MAFSRSITISAVSNFYYIESCPRMQCFQIVSKKFFWFPPDGIRVPRAVITSLRYADFLPRQSGMGEYGPTRRSSFPFGGKSGFATQPSPQTLINLALPLLNLTVSNKKQPQKITGGHQQRSIITTLPKYCRCKHYQSRRTKKGNKPLETVRPADFYFILQKQRRICPPSRAPMGRRLKIPSKRCTRRIAG